MTRYTYLILLILALAITAFAQADAPDDPKRPTSLAGITEAVLIDGQPAIRFLSRGGDIAYAKLVKRDGDDTFAFRIVRTGAGHITRPKYGTLYVSAKNVLFDPDENKSNYLNVPKTDIVEAEMGTPAIGKVAIVFRYQKEKTMFILNFGGINNNVKSVELWPSTSFMLRTIRDFDKALAEFKELTASAIPKVYVDEDEDLDEFIVSSRFDRFQGNTVVATSKMPVKGKRTVRIFAEYTYPEKTWKKPDTFRLHLYASAGSATFMDESLGLTFLADDERLPMGQMKIVEEEKTSSIVRQTVAVDLPYGTMAKITNAKQVEFQIGRQEYKLTPKHLAALKELLDHRPGDTK